MRRASAIEKESLQIVTVEDLTRVFESISSTQVAKVKNKAALSKQFFDLLWSRYSSIRIDPKKRITGRGMDDGNSRKALVLISAEAGLSGDLDQRMIETMQQDYNASDTDIIVLGSHGATQLTQQRIPFIRLFQVPETDHYVNVDPVIQVLLPYSKIIVYYEEYVSLGQQDVKKIDLISHIGVMSQKVEENIITDLDTIFEPSLDEIADQMEATMMSLALSQTILESSLAQAASRFNAMAVAKKRAGEMLADYRLEFHRAKRSESDRRLREVMVSLKKKRAHAGGKR